MKRPVIRRRLTRARHRLTPARRAPDDRRTPRARRPVALVAAAAVLAAVVLAAGAWLGGDTLRVTAYFTRAIGLHEGSDLRVLGVTVGRVADVHPEGTRVRVTLEVDEGVAVPASAQAVVVAPSVVSGRFLQLTPAYTGGPRLADGDVIPAERTLTPLEIDELAASLTELSDTLGPEGAGRDGALGDLLDVGAENLKGNGAPLGETLSSLGAASQVLSDSSGDFVSTVKNLQTFTGMLKDNDDTVRTAARQLGDVADFLADDKEDLGDALRELSTALGDVGDFLADHRLAVAGNVDRLTTLTQSLVDQRHSLAEALETAPLAAGNAVRAYNPRTGTIDGRVNLNELSLGAGPRLERLPPGEAERTTFGLPVVGDVHREAEVRP
ncbi:MULTISPECIES: MCE family protein [Streptomyces]|uniref:MCE family protein n=1 Tax=Streptomyces TaxID=1883 RepID=UPI002248986F|nr:MCE family protein [Streptomyces sp. JHD 1]MCX2968335.1 MCE family protein [Streptomyces sp. JHD 1]